MHQKDSGLRDKQCVGRVDTGQRKIISFEFKIKIACSLFPLHFGVTAHTRLGPITYYKWGVVHGEEKKKLLKVLIIINNNH